MSQEQNSDATHEVTLSFSANMRFVRPIRHFIGELCALAEYAEEEAGEIALVATEILNNSIEHGCSGEADQVEVTLAVTRDAFRFEVIDAGRGGSDFATAAASRSEHMPGLDEPRGRGLYLINSFMDELEVSYDPKRGTSFRVAKKRQP